MTEEQIEKRVAAAEHNARPGWYWWLVMIATCLSCAAASISIAVLVQERALEREREQRIEVDRKAAALRAETDAKWCELISTFDDEYRKTPPSTSAGVSIAKAMRDLRVLYCR